MLPGDDSAALVYVFWCVTSDSVCPFGAWKIGAEGSLNHPDAQLLNRARLLQARALVSDWSPFLGHLVLQMPVRIQRDGPCGTAWVDGNGHCGFDEAFLSALDPQEAAVVLLHETLHLALDCFARRGDRDARLWNMAHDLAVNLLIEDSRGHHPTAWPKGLRPLLHPACKDMSAEAIYDLLWDALKLQRQSDPWPGHPGPATAGEQAVIHKRWGGERLAAAEEILPRVIDLDLQEGPGATAEERERLRRRWQEGMLSAAERAMGERGIGSLPGWAQRLLGPMLQPQVPWQTVMATRLLGRLAGGRRSFARPGRRSQSLGLCLPGRIPDRGVVGVFVDVSGSVSPGELDAFLGELRGILETTRCQVRFLAWDAGVGGDLLLESSADLDRALLEQGGALTGGGGTDPRCILDHFAEDQADHPLPTLAVLLTDGCVPWPDAADWPFDVLVVSTGPLPPKSLGYESLSISRA